MKFISQNSKWEPHNWIKSLRNRNRTLKNYANCFSKRIRSFYPKWKMPHRNVFVYANQFRKRQTLNRKTWILPTQLRFIFQNGGHVCDAYVTWSLPRYAANSTIWQLSMRGRAVVISTKIQKAIDTNLSRNDFSSVKFASAKSFYSFFFIFIYLFC